MSRTLGFALFILCSFSALAAASEPSPTFSLALARDGVQDREIPGLLAFLSDAEARLPPFLKLVLSRQIVVHFTDELDSTMVFQIPPCGPGQARTSEGDDDKIQVRGRVSAGWFQREASIDEIRLNAVMKEEILKGPEHSTPYGCGHGSLYRLALATLLHEISHLYDFSDYQTPERRQQLERCDRLQDPERGVPDPPVRYECMSADRTRVVSNTPTFSSLIDWDTETGQRLNDSAFRSPDPYEYSSLEEEFAVNMEYFLLDPDYACRRPSEFEYLKDHFGGFDPFPTRQCRISPEVQLASNSLGRSSSETALLDPSRVYQIHFLFASEGPMLMSNWGHAMFRIILCNPSRKEVGPDCLSDLKDHIIVSYAANPGNWSISAWDGLVGNYPSQLFLYRLYPDIVNEYNVDEFRDLISLPLKLSEAEKTRFVLRVLEQYWQYTGTYYFLSNNCATEAMHLLKGVIRDFDFQYWDIQTPVELYRKLAANGYIDKHLLDDHENALAKGYLFPSQKGVYEGAFARIRQVSPDDVPVETFDDYVSESNAADRLVLYRKLNALGPDRTKGLASRFFILESYIHHTEGNAFMNAVMNKLQSESSGMGQKASQMVQLANDASLPWNRQMTGYGIAMPGDAQASADAASRAVAQNAQVRALYEEVMSWAKQNLAARAAELDAIAANQKFFLSEMRREAPQIAPVPAPAPTPAPSPKAAPRKTRRRK